MEGKFTAKANETLTERFDAALLVMIQNLGPHLTIRMQLGLTPGQVLMLHFLQQQKQCSVSRLAEKVEVNPSAITVMLDRLEHHGYVVRTRLESDRRVVMAQLTSAGEKLLNQVLEVRKQIIEHCLAQVNPDELHPFVQTLEKLAAFSAEMNINNIIALENRLEE